MQPSSLGVGVGHGVPLSSLTENGNIGHLIDDAMEDILTPVDAPPKTTPTSSTTNRATVQSRSKKSSNKVTSSQSKSKMEIHVSGDNSVIMDFNSDSDDDDDDDILRDLMSHHHPRKSVHNESRDERKQHKDLLSPTRKSMKQSGSDHSSIFSESDDDFCFVDAPTITKVVSTTIFHTVNIQFTHTCTCVIFRLPEPGHRSNVSSKKERNWSILKITSQFR